MNVIHNACFRVPEPVMYFVPTWRCMTCHHVMVTDASPGDALSVGKAECWCENCGAGPYQIPIMTSSV